MVDVTDKKETARMAKATGRLHLSKEALLEIQNGTNKKGDVLATARIAGIMAVKKTAELINRELVKVKGIACHLSLGEFCVYCRHKTNYPEIFEKCSASCRRKKAMTR